MRLFLGVITTLCFSTHAAFADDVINLSEDVSEFEASSQKEFMPEKLDFVTEDVEFDEPAPYVGLSFSDNNNNNENWEFKANIGVKYNGETDVVSEELASYQNTLMRQEWELQNNSDELDVNPVVMMNLKYHF